MTADEYVAPACSLCGGQMVTGMARIHGTLRGWAWVGLSYQNLYFEADGSETEYLQLESQTPLAAWRCADCRALVLPCPPRDKPRTLLSDSS